MTEQLSFVEAVEKLPEERKRAVQHWFGTQLFIAEALGLETDEWFTYVDWAIHNPLDFSFVYGGGKKAGRAPSAAEQKKAKAVMGAVTGTKLPGGGGPGNLVGFMASKDKRQKD